MPSAAEAPKVGVREVAIVATPLLTLLLSAFLLFKSLPALEVRDRPDTLGRNRTFPN